MNISQYRRIHIPTNNLSPIVQVVKPNLQKRNQPAPVVESQKAASLGDVVYPSRLAKNHSTQRRVSASNTG
jgi:hypothetical protein